MMKKYLLILLTFWGLKTLSGQGLPIRISITIIPPYPTSLSYYGDHPQQVVINVTNSSREEQSFRLVGSITGTDNNVKVLARDRGASGIIILNPGESRLLTVPEIQDLFDASKFAYTGISYRKSQIDDGLPEGAYEVCGYAVDAYQTNVQKGESSCSNPVFVTNLEPPMIINPFPDAQVIEMPVQNMVFTWTLPASAPPNTEYTLTMVEIMGNLNPNNAIQSATTPIFFERSVQFNTLLFGPADPPLTAGRKYAYMVTARDPMGKAVFRNNGRSAVQVFTYGNVLVPPTPVTYQSGTKIKVRTINLLSPNCSKRVNEMTLSKTTKPDSTNMFFHWDTLGQKKSERYSLSIVRTSGITALEVVKISGINMSGYQVFRKAVPFPFVNGSMYKIQVKSYQTPTGNVSINQADYTVLTGESAVCLVKYKEEDPNKETKHFTATVKYRFDGTNDSYPFEGKVSLYKSYRIADTLSGKVYIDSIPAILVNNLENNLAGTIQTDSKGRFTLDFDTYKTPKTLPGAYAGYPPTAQLQPFYQIQLNNPYLTENNQRFFLKGKDTTNSGVIEVFAQSYSLKLNLKKGYITGGYSNKLQSYKEAMDGTEVSLVRKVKAGNIPFYEGGMANKVVSNPAGTVIGKETAQIINNSKGEPEAIVNFEKLFISPDISDQYFIRLKDKKGNTFEQAFSYSRPNAYNLVLEQMKKKAQQDYENSKSGNTNADGDGKYMTPAAMLDYIQQSAIKSEKVNEHRYKVEKEMIWGTTDPPLSNLKGRIQFSYPDGLGGQRPLTNQKVILKSYIFKVDPNNPNASTEYLNLHSCFAQEYGANCDVTPVSGKADKLVSNLFNSIVPEVLAVTNTDANGYFEFKEIPMWDSVRALNGTYQYVKNTTKLPEKEIEQKNVTKEDMVTYVEDLKKMKQGSEGDPYNWKSGIDQISKIDPMADVSASKGAGFVNGSLVTTGFASDKMITGDISSQFQNGASPAKNKKNGLNLNKNMPGGPMPFDDYWDESELEMTEAGETFKLKRVLRVVVENEDFVSPGTDIVLQPLQSRDVGTLNTYIQSFKLKLSVSAKDETAFNAISNVELLLKKSGDLYPGEADKKSTATKYQRSTDGNLHTLDRIMTAQGTANGIKNSADANYFYHLVGSPYGYSLYASTNDTLNSNVAYAPHTYFFTQNKDPYSELKDQTGHFGEFTYDYSEPIFGFQLKMEKKDPIIAGRVLLGIPKAKGVIENATVKLSSIFATIPADTKSDGYFTFTNLALGIARNLKITKAGYHLTDSLGKPDYNSKIKIDPLQKGQKWFKNIFLVPNGTITGYVVNESGENIPSTYKVTNMTLMQETVDNCDAQEQQEVNEDITSFGDEIDLDKTITGSYGFSASYKPQTNFKDVYKQEVCQQVFKAYAVPGQSTQLIVTPNDLKYFADTIMLANPKVDNDLGAIKVITRKHRIIFIVKDPKKSAFAAFIPNVKIKILDTVLTTGTGGSVKYEFENVTTQNFKVIVTPGPNSNYIPQQFTFSNDETKEYISKTINLEMGQEVTGKVLLNGAPLPGAIVHAEQGGSNIDRPVATAGSDGTYILRGIKAPDPIQTGLEMGSIQLPVLISATAPENALQTIIGQTLVVQVLNQQLIVPGGSLNFNLKGYDALNITKLLGYNVNITSLQPSSGGAIVSGEIMLNKQSDFEVFNPNNPIKFENLKVSANSLGKKDSKGILYAEPEGDIALSNYTITTRFRDAYNIDIEKPAGKSNIIITKSSPLSGQFTCKARLVDNSFDFPGSYFSFKNPSDNVNTQFYLANTGKDVMIYDPVTKKSKKVNSVLGYSTNVSLLQTSESDYSGTPAKPEFIYNLTDKDGNALQFKLLEFDAKSVPSESYFDNKSIRIKPEVTAYIDDWKDPVTQQPKQLVVPLDEVRISNQGISPIKNTGKPIEFSLEEWTISIKNWTLNTEEGGFYSTSGTINTNILNIPFKKFRLRARDILVDNIQLSQIKVGDILPLTLNPNPTTTFGYDPKTGNDLKGHYIFRLLGANGENVGKIAKSNLEGFKNDLGFKAFTLVSEGSQYVDFSTQLQTVNVNNIIDFKPNQLTISNGAVDLEGTLDFGIPRLQDIYAGFRFKKQGNGISKTLKPMDFKFDIGKGYVEFTTTVNSAQVLSENYLELHGTATEPGKLPNFPVVITKKSDSNINMLLDAPTAEIKLQPNTFLITKSDDPKLTGAVVVNNDWDFFRLTGKFKGFSGLPDAQQLPITLVVYGEIKAENSAIKVDQISTPFGNLNLTLDFVKPELHGSLEINGVEISPGIGASGVAEVLVGSPGFYFMVAAEASLPVPILSPLKAGILIGLHKSISPEVFTKVQQYNYHKTKPCGYTALTGFLVTGRKDIIEPVNEQIGIPGIFQGDVQLEVGADASVMMNFANSATLDIATGVFGKAYLSLGSGLSCTFLSFGATVDAQAKLSLSQKQVSGNVCAGVSLTGSFEQDTPLLVGCGPKIVGFSEAIAASIAINASSSSGLSCKFKTSGCNDDNSCK